MSVAAAASDIANAFLLVFAGLFPMVNPVGGAPIFLALTQHCTAEECHALARRVAVNGFLLLLGSLFIGSHVLEFFGITLPVVRIAGGLVVSSFGWRLLHQGAELPVERGGDAEAGAIDAFYPLTMPLTVGPGSIAVAIALGSRRPAEAAGLAVGGAIGGLVAIAATIFLCYRYAGRIVAILGDRGTNVMVRLSAFILLCIGIEIVWNGYIALTAALSP